MLSSIQHFFIKLKKRHIVRFFLSFSISFCVISFLNLALGNSNVQDIIIGTFSFNFIMYFFLWTVSHVLTEELENKKGTEKKSALQKIEEWITKHEKNEFILTATLKKWRCDVEYAQKNCSISEEQKRYLLEETPKQFLRFLSSFGKLTKENKQKIQKELLAVIEQKRKELEHNFIAKHQQEILENCKEEVEISKKTTQQVIHIKD